VYVALCPELVLKDACHAPLFISYALSPGAFLSQQLSNPEGRRAVSEPFVVKRPGEPEKCNSSLALARELFMRGGTMGGAAILETGWWWSELWGGVRSGDSGQLGLAI
jgi:hypothetical protein